MKIIRKMKDECISYSKDKCRQKLGMCDWESNPG